MSTMKCPYCGVSVGLDFRSVASWEEMLTINDEGYGISVSHCSECFGLVVTYDRGILITISEKRSLYPKESREVIYPTSVRKEIAQEVPEPFRTDYREAWAVLPISPKASAAISRRILQHILHDCFSIKKSDLAKEIEEFIHCGDTPTYLADAVDAIRHIGNFAAHPIKAQSTGAIVDVEPGEAEWLLEALEALFDFAFVQPIRLKQRRKELNEKLQELGKPPMKGVPPGETH